MPQPDTSSTTPPSPFPKGSVVVAFLLLAGVFVLDPWGRVPPPRAYVPRGPEVVDTTPRRSVPDRHPTIERAGNTYSCNECHKHFKTSEPVRDRTMGEHSDITLAHGDNNRCFNCHHDANRGALVDHGGEEIPFDQVPRLCGKCHGTIYRDWKRGIHGKRVGSWELDSPDRVALACNECHDPHAPQFAPMVPAPAPRGPDIGRGRATAPIMKEAPGGR